MRQITLNQYAFAALGCASIVLGALWFVFVPSVHAATITDSYYWDANSDGIVDQIVWEFDDVILSCTYDAADWTIEDSGDVGVIAVNDISCDNPLAQENHTLYIDVSTQFPDKTGGADPVISYEPTGDHIEMADPASLVFGQYATTYYLEAFLFFSASDSMPPHVVDMDAYDSNADGAFDTLHLQFSEDVSVVGIEDALSVGLGCSVSDWAYIQDHLISVDLTGCTTSTGPGPTVYYEGTDEVTDLSSNAMTDDIAANADDMADPIVRSVNPSNGAQDVDPDTAIEIQFSETMDTTATEGAITLSQNSQAVPVDFSWDNTDSVVTLQPASTLDENTEYTLEVDGARGSFGGTLRQYTTSFITGVVAQQTQQQPPQGTDSRAHLLDRAQANAQLPAGIAVDDLVKLPNDGDPTTYSDTAVYYIGLDGKRHPFWNAQIFRTWYEDFDDVRTIDVQTMADIPLGNTILVRPGTRWVKIQSVPKTYYVEPNGYTLRWITSEEAAEILGGSNWNQNIIDVPPTLFNRFNFGPVLTATDLQNGDWPEGALVRDVQTNDVWYITEDGRRRIDANGRRTNRFQNRFIRTPSETSWRNRATQSDVTNFEDRLFSEELPTP